MSVKAVTCSETFQQKSVALVDVKRGFKLVHLVSIIICTKFGKYEYFMIINYSVIPLIVN